MVVDDRRVVDDRAIDVDVAHNGRVHVHDSGVVYEMIAAPMASHKPDASVPKAVVNAAVESYVRPPVARMPSVKSAFKAPIARRPEHTGSRRRHPNSRDPIVTLGPIRPISGRPEVPVLGAR